MKPAGAWALSSSGSLRSTSHKNPFPVLALVTSMGWVRGLGRISPFNMAYHCVGATKIVGEESPGLWPWTKGLMVVGNSSLDRRRCRKRARLDGMWANALFEAGKRASWERRTPYILAVLYACSLVIPYRNTIPALKIRSIYNA
jgi:hypothetical protein